MNEKVTPLGESESFHSLLEEVSKVAKLSRSVLVIGERGSGKELIAERIHFLSKRWDQDYLKVNCATLSEELLASELFGHEAGAFTGAQKLHIGRFERANGGTLFLDEIANTSLALQEKILRVVEYGEFERVGGNKIINVDVRVVAATNEDLPTAVEKGKFRADLLDRLAFDVLTIPPLRHRDVDIMLLAEHFAIKMSRELDHDYFAGFSEEVKHKLNKYHWPGNVRELKNLVERAVYRWEDIENPIDEIQIDPFESPFRPKTTVKKEEINNLEHLSSLDYKMAVNGFEQKTLKDALEKNQYNQKKTARFLNLTYNQLRGLLRKHKIG